MTVFRWLMGLLAVFFAAGAMFGFVLFIAFESTLWIERARRLRHWLWLVALLWFNVEVWGRVVVALVRWKS